MWRKFNGERDISRSTKPANPLFYSERLSGKRPVCKLFNDAELRLTIYAAGAGADGSG